MKRTLLLAVLLSLTALCAKAQVEKKLQKEDDGFRWYELTQNNVRGAETTGGKTLIPLSRGYTFICYHNSDGGHFSVEKPNKDNKNCEGICDKNGKELFTPDRFETVYYNKDDDGFVYFTVMLNGEKGVYESNTREVIPPKYDAVCRQINEGIYYYGVTLDRKKGACDKRGREVIPPIFDNVVMHGLDGDFYYGVTLDGKEGAYDINGREIIAPKYKDGLIFSSGEFKYKDSGGKWVSTGLTLADGHEVAKTTTQSTTTTVAASTSKPQTKEKPITIIGDLPAGVNDVDLYFLTEEDLLKYAQQGYLIPLREYCKQKLFFTYGTMWYNEAENKVVVDEKTTKKITDKEANEVLRLLESGAAQDASCQFMLACLYSGMKCLNIKTDTTVFSYTDYDKAKAYLTKFQSNPKRKEADCFGQPQAVVEWISNNIKK